MRYHRVIVCFLFIRMTTQHRIKVHPKIENTFPMLIDRNAQRDANVSNAIECMPVCRKLYGKKRKNVRMEWKINADVVIRSPADPKITIKCFVQTSHTHKHMHFSLLKILKGREHLAATLTPWPHGFNYKLFPWIVVGVENAFRLFASLIRFSLVCGADIPMNVQ